MSADKRRETRTAQQDILHLQLARGDDAERGLLLHASTDNISPGGLRARTNRAVNNGRIFDVLVELPQQAAPFLLTVEVRWCHRAALDYFDVGFSILPASHSDFQQWQSLFESPQREQH